MIGVQSVGPKMAQAVLSGGSPRELIAALAAGDVKRLTAVPGIGKRTAERIIVELREKVGTVERPAGRRHHRRAAATTRAAWPATAWSSWASRSRRPSGCWPRPRATRPRTCCSRRCGRRAHERPADPDARTRPSRRTSTARCGPRRLQDFIGQDGLKDQLSVSLEAARLRGEALDHVLLAGPPGLGKTSLAQILAAELEVPFVQTAGPALERKADIASFLSALEPRTSSSSTRCIA